MPVSATFTTIERDDVVGAHPLNEIMRFATVSMVLGIGTS